jgi:uncharacterized Ntn-hydrolase superfamily protein
VTFTVLFATDEALVVGSASCVPGVGRIVPHVTRGVGAAASQARGEASIGRAVLAGLADGATPEAAVSAALADAGDAERRQVAVVTPGGGHAAHTGADCHDHHGVRTGPGTVVCGNLLTGPEVLDAAAEALAAADRRGPVPAVLDALRAAEAAGGDARGRMSAALRAVGTGLTTGLAAAVDGELDVRIDRSVDPLDDLVEAVTTDLAYQLVDAHAQGAGPADVDEAVAFVDELAPRSPDASAAVLYCLEVVAGRFGEVARGREVAEAVVARRPGPAADARTVAYLWKPLEGHA